MKLPTYILTIVYLSSLLVTGCRKEAKLTPTTDPEDVYNGNTLPQGNHPYDADIKQLFDKYQTLFLYKYVHHDLYYNVNDDFSGIYDTVSDNTTKGGYFDVPADEGYIGALLDTLKNVWLNYYPDSLLKKGLPQKVFLVDSFYFAYPGPGKPVDNYPVMADVYSGGDYILAARGGARILNMTPEDRYAFKAQLNSAFLTFAHKLGAVRPSTTWGAITDYASLNYLNYYALGAIYQDPYGNNPDKDWDSYMTAIVSNSYATLTSPGNILDPAVDVNGLIRQRYDMMIAYFKTLFGVDLQAIGDAGSQ